MAYTVRTREYVKDYYSVTIPIELSRELNVTKKVSWICELSGSCITYVISGGECRTDIKS